MERIVDKLGWIVVDASISAALLLGVVTLAMLSCRQPARRLLLARTAVIAVLLLIPVSASGLAPRCDVVGIARSAKLLSSQTLASPLPVGIETDASIAADSTSSLGGIFQEDRRFRTLLFIDAFVVLLGLGRLALGSLIVSVMKRRAGEPSAASLALYERLDYPLGRDKPSLRVAGRIRRPMLAGLFQPIILIPPELDEPNAESELRLALVHELTHSARRDHWHGFVANVALVFWFYLPPIWWIWSRLRLDQEFVVDQIAARRFGGIRDYAATLFNMAARSSTVPREASEFRATPSKVEDRWSSETITVDAQASPVYQRVAMLLRCPFPIEARPPRSWAWPSMIGVAVAALLAASVSIQESRVAEAPPKRLVKAFHMAKLELKALRAGVKGRAPLFELPVRLPRKFDLTLEVWGDLVSLCHSRVAGIALSSDPSILVDPLDSTAPGWHKVHLKRDATSISLWIDEKPAIIPPESTGTTAWLSVEPLPELEASYRNLTLTW